MGSESRLDRLQRLAEDFDPSTVEGRDGSDLREIAEIVDSLKTDQARLREHVSVARAHGRSWGEIGIALGTSRQAARERFGGKVTA